MVSPGRPTPGLFLRRKPAFFVASARRRCYNEKIEKISGTGGESDEKGKETAGEK